MNASTVAAAPNVLLRRVADLGIENRVRSRIGEAMIEVPDICWLVASADQTLYAGLWNERMTPDAERVCRAWLQERARPSHPHHGRPAGAHALRAEVWPNYLGMTDAGARFINWGLLQLDAGGHKNMLTRMLGGEHAQVALAAILFPEPP
mgnify:CR=1 FL=1|jgi:hypothetical protein